MEKLLHIKTDLYVTHIFQKEKQHHYALNNVSKYRKQKRNKDKNIIAG